MANLEEESYKQFEDYFGLTNMAWKTDLLSSLNDAVMGGNSDSNSLCLNAVTYDGFSSFDPLEVIRSDHAEEFRQNGIESELDELDFYQSQLREQTTADKIFMENTDNPVLQEYLALKEKRKAVRRLKKKVCVFCKNNGEPTTVYSSHLLKDADGKVACPILRKYTCPLCGISGDNGHTIKYCPKNNGESPSLSLLKTCRLSTGKKRKF